MLRTSTLVAVAFTFVTASTHAEAQGVHNHQHIGQPQRIDHGYWHQNYHVPNVVKLDSYSDQLANIARHLHEDAHKLSQDYEHSESIERYVDSVDRLQSHMHEVLHRAVESGQQSTALATHVINDVRQVKQLLTVLYGELQHQGVDGARTQDYYAMDHMRKILVQNAFPLIRQMEIELFGYPLDGQAQAQPINHRVQHAQPQHAPAQQHQPTYVPQPYQQPPRYQVPQQQVQRPAQGRPTIRVPSSPIQGLLRSALQRVR